jgi:hypothetical protein
MELEDQSRVIHSHQQQLKTICCHFYSSFYTKRTHEATQDICKAWTFNGVLPCITAAMVESLQRPLILRELPKALGDMAKDKSSSFDGITVELYKCM